MQRQLLFSTSTAALLFVLHPLHLLLCFAAPAELRSCLLQDVTTPSSSPADLVFDQQSLEQCGSLVAPNEAIDDDGASKLATAMISTDHRLRQLLLGGNNIGAVGAKALAKALLRQKSVVELGFGWNKLGDEGAAAIANVVRQDKQLQAVGLEFNSI